MFLEILCRRNPDFVSSVVHLHQRGDLKANTYVLDFDAIVQNLKHIQSEASRYKLTIYPMTKQVGRNHVILKLIKEINLGKVVAVDWMGAQQIIENGGEIGHVGHLVQIPKTETLKIAKMSPEVWTVFSYEKAAEISKVLEGENRTQQLLLRVWKEGDTFYPGHEGGIHLKNVLETARQIGSLPNVKVCGVTSFPCLLFNQSTKELYLTPNMDTIIEASEVLSNNGFEITQINAPGTTSTVTLGLLAKGGATHVEPGHGMTGTTPAHAFDDLPEIPAILYLSEISHTYQGYAYFYGGGLYVDPVFQPYPVKALLGRDGEGVLKGRYEVILPDPGSIDYYGMLKIDSEKVKSGDTVILCFRPQVFHTRARVAVIRNKSNMPYVMGMWDAFGREVSFQSPLP